jgi:hypothetical protein
MPRTGNAKENDEVAEKKKRKEKKRSIYIYILNVEM